MQTCCRLSVAAVGLSNTNILYKKKYVPEFVFVVTEATVEFKRKSCDFTHLPDMPQTIPHKSHSFEENRRIQ
jgi:hypothetical protein